MTNEELLEKFEEFVSGIEVGLGSMSFDEICEGLNELRSEVLQRMEGDF